MSGARPWRVVLVSQVAEIAQLFADSVRELGHEAVAHVVARRLTPEVEPPPFVVERMARIVSASPPALDLVMPARKEGLARVLRGYEPDLVLCFAFPWRIPADALAVPRLGIVNAHPSLLPAYRGPTPISWAIRNGDAEVGVSFHRMDEQFDTGHLLAQERVAVDDDETFDSLNAKLAAAAGKGLPRVFERLDGGELGDPQPEEGASYQSLFEPEFALVDLERARREVHDQVRAWRMTPFAVGERGAILEREGTRVRVLRTSLVEAGGDRIECADGPLWVLETEPV